MADWSGEIYVYEGDGRLFRGTTKVSQDGIQESLGARKRVVARAAVAAPNSAAVAGSAWWNDLRRQSSKEIDENDVVDSHQGPPRLFQIALSFVAAHISNVDSLDGFPDEVGRQLFDEGHRLGRFRRPEDCVEPFRLFSEAYGPVFASKLTLSRMTVSTAICEIVTKSCSSSLDEVRLRDVKFESPGVCQSLLQGIGRMPRLRKLSLIGCDLKDADVRLLTAHARLYGQTSAALADLEEIDLSDNYNVSGMIVRYLRVFTNLRLVTLTGTSVESNDGLRQLKRLGLDLASTEQVSRLLSIQKGRYDRVPDSFSAGVPWADRVFADWHKTSADQVSAAAENQGKKPKFKFSTFYNATKEEKAKETRAQSSSHAVPVVFVRRKVAGRKGLGLLDSPTTSTSRSGSASAGKRKRSALVEAESVLHQLFDENRSDSTERGVADCYDEHSAFASRDDENDFATQYATAPSPERKKAKGATSSIFEFM